MSPNAPSLQASLDNQIWLLRPVLRLAPLHKLVIVEVEPQSFLDEGSADSRPMVVLKLQRLDDFTLDARLSSNVKLRKELTHLGLHMPIST